MNFILHTEYLTVHGKRNPAPEQYAECCRLAVGEETSRAFETASKSPHFERAQPLPFLAGGRSPRASIATSPAPNRHPQPACENICTEARDEARTSSPQGGYDIGEQTRRGPKVCVAFLSSCVPARLTLTLVLVPVWHYLTLCCGWGYWQYSALCSVEFPGG